MNWSASSLSVRYEILKLCIKLFIETWQAMRLIMVMYTLNVTVMWIKYVIFPSPSNYSRGYARKSYPNVRPDVREKLIQH